MQARRSVEGDAKRLVWPRGERRIHLRELTKETFVSALAIHLRYGICHWDSLIVASAKASGCEIIDTEDLNHGQITVG
ncbi:MAG: hypothetical protein ACNA8L_08925 [Luteolibacter sp.]